MGAPSGARCKASRHRRTPPAEAAGRIARKARRGRGPAASVLRGYSCGHDRELTPHRGRPRARRLARHAAALGRGGASCRCATASGRRRRSPRRGIVARLRKRAATAGPAARGGPQRAGSPTATWRTCSRRRADAHARRGGRGDRARAGADRAHLDRRRVLAGRRSTTSSRTTSAAALLAAVLDAGLPARRLPAARPRLRPGARPDRRRRGQALPPLRPRAADPRGRRRARDRRGDGRPRVRAAAAERADHGARPPALPAALHRAGRRRPPGVEPATRTPSSAACGWRSRSPTSPATRG